MALGVKEGDGGAHLITYHPRGPGRSAEHIHQAEWLDFNMCQSLHGAHDHDNGLFIDHDYALEPPKPTVDGEPRYETMPVGFYHKEASRYDLSWPKNAIHARISRLAPLTHFGDPVLAEYNTSVRRSAIQNR